MRTILLFLSLFLAANAVVYCQLLSDFGAPSEVPAILAQGRVSTGQYERDFALSPDGTEIFYTLQSPLGVFQTILYMKKDGKGNWGQPVVAPFAGQYSDLEPAFSPDGKRLYFSSNRPVSGDKIKDFDIWVVNKESGVWSTPRNIGLPVNTPADEFYPSVALSGNLYFTAAYVNSVGKEDIYMAKWEQGKFAQPVALDTAINSITYEFNAFVSPAEDYILFTSYGRKDDKGRGDLYFSISTGSGKWTPARNLAPLNSERLDYCPFVSPDGMILFFTSERMMLPNSYPATPADLTSLLAKYTSTRNGGGDIYWIRFDTLLQALKEKRRP